MGDARDWTDDTDASDDRNAAAVAARHETVEELLRARLSTAIGGWRGAVESAVPTIAFVAVWNLTGVVGTAAAAAVAAALVVAVVRLAQRQTLRYVGFSVAAVVIAAFFATRSGRAEDAFLPGMIQTGVNLLVFLIANLVRWPLFGFLIAAGDPDLVKAAADVRASTSKSTRSARAALSTAEREALELDDLERVRQVNSAMTAWRRHDGIVTVASRLGWIMVGLAVVRLAIQVPLYLNAQVEALGVAKLLLGWPAYLIAVGLGALLLLRGRTPLDGTDGTGRGAL